ncbi:hypothetical protein [Streptomyces mangrovisoli]|uniref:DUF3558 domain-containing protein n=1 Tax=Streptomyces mangrovisoli TaxID=1428628 RepID=A0A1J4NWQ7_9ACTN|nr:hypothetical protein [Streptomyces mangrovisoli]OIJ66744.1 hypothetical protein WN71_016370 [Streptomyces mangrovisoli]
MQRKAYVSGTAALLMALLAGCSGSSGSGSTVDDSNPGDAGTATAVAQPGKYRTLPEACGAASRSTLDALLPGIKQITDADQRDEAYQGDATLTYDTDRKDGCRWKVDSADATDHLLVDFERVVSYDSSVSDDDQAQKVFATKETAADLPAPAPSETPAADASTSGTDAADNTGKGDDSAAADGANGASSGSSADPQASASPTATPADLQPRVLDDLGDEAYLDDAVASSGSTAKQRTVTVVFRTSNVIVTIEYAEQPATAGVVPDSAEMQDSARKLAAELADSLSG